MTMPNWVKERAACTLENNFLTIEKSIKRAACKTLIDSERRKNTRASNDVRARQLARF